MPQSATQPEPASHRHRSTRRSPDKRRQSCALYVDESAFSEPEMLQLEPRSKHKPRHHPELLFRIGCSTYVSLNGKYVNLTREVPSLAIGLPDVTPGLVRRPGIGIPGQYGLVPFHG